MANTVNLGVLQASDSDLATINSIGQSVVYQATEADIDEHNLDIRASIAPFVDADTEDYKRKYIGSAGGRLQRRGLNSAPAEIKGAPSWDIALPLEDFAGAIAINDVLAAKMPIAKWNKLVGNVLRMDKLTVRAEMLKALLNKTGNANFQDEDYGTLAIKPLANQDGTLYSPVDGSEAPAQANCYVGVAADSQTLTDANNPLPAAVDKLEARYGPGTADEPIVCYIHSDQTTSMRNLSAFHAVSPVLVSPGSDTAVVRGYPEGLPGRVIGECNGALVVEWRGMPSGYELVVHMGAPKPLLRRVDPERYNLGKGLRLVAKRAEFPIETSYWRHRYGFGAGERTNGVAIDLKTGGGTYTTPPAYA